MAKSLDEVGVGIGISSVTFTESETSLEGDNIAEPASGAISVITANLYYKFLHGDKISYYAQGYFPLISSGDNSSFGAGISVEYFFTKENSVVRERDSSMSFSVDPKLRYYATGGVNLVYLSYITDEEKKNDINVELHIGGGMTYSITKKYGLKADISVGRGVGVLTSTFAVRAFGSFVYYWDR